MTTHTPLQLEDVARLPAPGDNVALATRTLTAGLRVTHASAAWSLERPVLEGHRFAIQPIAAGEALLSWGLPFGRALVDIPAGAYVCNEAMLGALRGRNVPFALPEAPNFRDDAAGYVLDEVHFRPGVQVARAAEARTFLGYHRPGGRGAGTRNVAVLVGLTSRSASYVRALEGRLRGAGRDYPNLDGIAAVAHTEGAGDEPLNNRTLLLRTLAGFMVHPNVAAVLVADDGMGGITNADLRDFAEEHDYPLAAVPHAFLTLAGQHEADLEHGAALVRDWLPQVSAAPREPVPVSYLNLALQCGGSDAFSGVSGNPLAAAVAREIIRHGGAATLAETTELVGAESYLLQNTRDVETARAVLRYIEDFKELLAWHGVSSEGNTSGGNRYRGLYNITLKSIGAATKRDPAVRLDYAVDYAERMAAPGYYFMNTPGNDLESIAGQVAGGCNLIMFTTGNGSITNFPFVPTLKLMTTSARYRLLEREMDINAGAYLDGVPLETLTREALDLALAVASGARSKGERAGHTQVSLWRNWRQNGPGRAARLLSEPEPDGAPLPIRADTLSTAPVSLSLLRTSGGLAADQVGLILPTSLCAGQIARMAADRLNALQLGQAQGLSRFVALVHTEGCGAAVPSPGGLQHGTLLNYMGHPLVGAGLFLEHGCEKTHNDFMRRQLEANGAVLQRYGWASVQLDGGIEAVLGKIEAWFRETIAARPAPGAQAAGLEGVRLGLMTAGPLPDSLGDALARTARTIVAAGGTVVTPASASLSNNAAFVTGTLGGAPARPTLGYGQAAAKGGFHIMETPSGHWVETLTGLGATGVEVVLAAPGVHPAQGHPLVPVVQVSASAAEGGDAGYDLVLDADPSQWVEQMLGLVADTLSRRYRPKALARQAVDFQLTRGLLGISV